MFGKVAELDKYYLIVGFREVKVSDVEGFLKKVKDLKLNVTVQFFDARYVAGWEHLFFATLNALKSFDSQRNISNRLEIEVLLYASTQNQIEKAIRMVGLKPESEDVAVLMISDSKNSLLSSLKKIEGLLGGVKDDSVISMTHEKTRFIREAFGVSDVEFEVLCRSKSEEEALKSLIIEHMAMLSIT